MSFLYGCQYYPEHWPEERWETDLQIMRELSFNTLRIGEFAWSWIEPEEDRFEFEWLDRFLDLCKAYGFNVLLGVPIEAPPRWMSRKYPGNTLVNRKGEAWPFGYRNHYCIHHPAMRERSYLLTKRMAERYAGKSPVYGWQIGNELFKHFECFNEYCGDAFRTYLENKYSSIEALNDAWGTVFWSQDYADFEDVVLPFPDRSNPSMIVDYYRYRNEAVTNFHEMLADAIREADPYAVVTHNGQGFGNPLSLFRLGKVLTVPGVNNAPAGSTPESQCAKMSFLRSVNSKGFYVLEQQVGMLTVGNGLAKGPEAGHKKLYDMLTTEWIC